MIVTSDIPTSEGIFVICMQIYLLFFTGSVYPRTERGCWSTGKYSTFCIFYDDDDDDELILHCDTATDLI